MKRFNSLMSVIAIFAVTALWSVYFAAAQPVPVAPQPIVPLAQPTMPFKQAWAQLSKDNHAQYNKGLAAINADYVRKATQYKGELYNRNLAANRDRAQVKANTQHYNTQMYNLKQSVKTARGKLNADMDDMLDLNRAELRKQYGLQ